jgi:hypothetical protein
LISHRVRTSARLRVRPLANLRSRIVMTRIHHRMGVRRPGRANIRCSLRLRSIRRSVFDLRTRGCKRQRKTSNAC